ncbi:MAG: phosphodiester glycosidase family protein [Anaerolineae bacterium]
MRWLVHLLMILSACIPASPTATPTADVPTDSLESLFLRQGSVFFQAVRIDPTQYYFRTHYRAGEPLTLAQWQAELPDAEVIINANFFTPEHTVLGLLISDGVIHGTPYRDRGGMFFVDGEQVGIRNTVQIPYANEAFQQAVQAFPILVQDGEARYTNPNDTAISRRTVVAEDANGRIVMMVTAGFGISLPALSTYLADSDLNLVNALNLDGGGSTMMAITSSDTTIISVDPVPAVLAVYRR